MVTSIQPELFPMVQKIPIREQNKKTKAKPSEIKSKREQTFRHSGKSRKEIKAFFREERQTVQTMTKSSAFLPFRKKEFILGFWNVVRRIFLFVSFFFLFEQKEK